MERKKSQISLAEGLKAVLKCPLTGVKIFNALLKLIFFYKIWMHDHGNENTSNATFHFSVSF